MGCRRCSETPPGNLSSPRRCAFTDTGEFTPENWNCGTIEALLRGPHEQRSGEDESMQIIPVREPFNEDGVDDAYWDGWLILTRYKTRGRTSSAVHVGDFWPPQPLTLVLAESMLKLREQ